MIGRMNVTHTTGLLAGLSIATSVSLCAGGYSELYAAPAKSAQKFQQLT